ncbi:hypothetical protein B4135_2475 [Caldibacillus debilis]|uniref:Uncharacterized protein n=1 Tax=Caldibacillus debilis TaxID=301148 RepID=A0A150LZ17_9BACI|nr:hypothetical protein B4135_2475 [Caldibacillus debilis]
MRFRRNHCQYFNIWNKGIKTFAAFDKIICGAKEKMDGSIEEQ